VGWGEEEEEDWSTPPQERRGEGNGGGNRREDTRVGVIYSPAEDGDAGTGAHPPSRWSGLPGWAWLLFSSKIL